MRRGEGSSRVLPSGGERYAGGNSDNDTNADDTPTERGSRRSHGIPPGTSSARGESTRRRPPQLSGQDGIYLGKKAQDTTSCRPGTCAGRCRADGDGVRG